METLPNIGGEKYDIYGFMYIFNSWYHNIYE